MSTEFETESVEAIAVVGMACRFPGADTPEVFWENLRAGVESISRFTSDQLRSAGVPEELLREPSYVKAKGALADIGGFDAGFFGVSPREVEMMDPQHRIFLECAWEAFEDAAIEPGKQGVRTGVFAGVGLNSYLLRNLMSRPDLIESDGFFPVALGNDKDFLPVRVSYKLNLTGPSINVNTACSTSLTAVHLACQSLLAYQCDLAVAGAAAVSVPEKEGYVFQEGGILSPDGHCRPFDAAARGTVPGCGVGVVLLKRLEAAIAAGDPIHAVIRGAAINNDGSDKIGFTAPSVSGQLAVITEALALAGVEPSAIGYVETHGTGTQLGDPIEIAALTAAFRQGTDRRGFCAIGSVKSNVGHLDAAAGMAGLIKVVMALKHGLVPPSLHFDQPNPAIDFSASPFFVNTELKPWPLKEGLRRAGLSSFGIGGTNVHIILEQAPERPERSRVGARVLLPLSARSDQALISACAKLADHLKGNPEMPLGAVGASLSLGRRAFSVRACAEGRTIDEAISSLRRVAPKVIIEAPRIGFVFPNSGAECVNMGREIYEQEPFFRETVNRCCLIGQEILDTDLREILFPEHGTKDGRFAGMPNPRAALFIVEYALAKMLEHWGIVPVAMLGQGLGEYTAACLGGVFSLEEALSLVCRPESDLAGLRSALSAPKIPFISNVTGDWITDAAARSSDYWVRRSRDTGQFAKGINALVSVTDSIVEVGPGLTFSRLIQEHSAGVLTQSCLPQPQDYASSLAQLLQCVGGLWTQGVKIDWATFHENSSSTRVSLPTYPFERNRFWVEMQSQGTKPSFVAGRETPIESCYVPSWRRSLRLQGLRPPRAWLLVSEGGPFVDDVARRLEPFGRVKRIVPQKSSIAAILSDLPIDLPVSIVYLGLFDPPKNGALAGIAGFDDGLEKGFFGLLNLAQNLIDVVGRTEIELILVSSELHDVNGRENGSVEAATALGLLNVIPKELKHIHCRHIDAGCSNPAEDLIGELRSENSDRVVCYRGPHRWVPFFTPFHPTEVPSVFRRRGTYLITGGLGGIGYVVAQHLTQKYQAKLVLVGRSELEPQSTARWTEETRFATEERELSDQLQIVSVEDRVGFEKAMNALCSAQAADWLQSTGASFDRLLTTEGLRNDLRILPKFRKFFDSLIRILVKDGYAIHNAATDEWKLTPKFFQPRDLADLRDDVVQRFPGFEAQVELLTHCVSHYTAALNGTTEAIGVLFPDGGEGLAKKASARTIEHTHHRVYHLLLARIVEHLVAQSGGRTIRILEVGGGNGFLTSFIAPSLTGRNVEYWFTDLGKSFVMAVQRQAEEMNATHFKTAMLDIGRDPIAQGFAADSFDIIFGLDVIHATKEIRKTLAELQKVLAPGGLLCAIESTRGYRWNDMISGLAEGWWYFEDLDLRDQGSPLIPLQRWEEAFRTSGLDEVTAFPTSATERERRSCGLIVGRKADTPACRMRRLKATGADVAYFAADVADPDQMRTVITASKEKFGELRGVIHAAAVVRGAAIPIQTREIALLEMHAKARGARVLVDLLADEESLDFLLFCSSISSIRGGVGDAAYAGANSYLDVLASRLSASSGKRVVSINWDRWQGLGRAVRYEALHRKLTGQVLEGGIKIEEGLEVLERVLSEKGVAQVAVSFEDLTGPVSSMQEVGSSPAPSVLASPVHARPELKTQFIPPQTETQAAICRIWQEVLGVGQVGIEDDFHELGGDSLIALQVISRVRETLRLEVAVRLVFEMSTVAALAERLDAVRRMVTVEMGSDVLMEEGIV